jgi:hypothetical protein
MPNESRPDSDWLIERLAHGELSPERAEALRKARGADAITARIETLQASNREILAAYPADAVVAEVRRRAERTSTSARKSSAARRAFWLAAPVAALAAVVVIVARPAPSPRPTEEGPETIGIKGLRPELRVYRKTASGADRLRPGGKVRPRDTLQVAYVAAARKYGVVASIDGRGEVTLHLPETRGPAAALDKDGERATAHAFQLDDTPGPERFVFFTADIPFATDLAVEILRGKKTRPAGIEVRELTVEKETP